VLPPGSYRVVTDEELIQELSFPVYRRVATMIFVPVGTYNASIEMVTIDPRHLQEALDRDRAIPSTPGLTEQTGSYVRQVLQNGRAIAVVMFFLFG
jgi:hypothetical protein